MAVQIRGATNSAEVDANNNLLVRSPTNEDEAGFVQISSENDAGLVTGSRSVASPETTDDYRLRVAAEQPLYELTFEGTNVSTAHIQQNNTTMTTAQTGGVITLNSGGSVAINVTAQIRTYRYFPIYGPFMTYCEVWARTTNETIANAVIEIGLGLAAGTSAPTDGAFFRFKSDGVLRGIVNRAGTETESGDISLADADAPITSGQIHKFVVAINSGGVSFWVNDVLRASTPASADSPCPTGANQLPVFVRVYNTGSAPPSARTVAVGRISVSSDAQLTKPWTHVMSGMGQGSYQTQVGSAAGPTVLRTAATNGHPSVTKTSGTWAVNTGPAAADLGGRWLTPAISTLTSESDYPVFAYLNPAGTNVFPGKTLYITGVRLGDTIVQAAASTNTILIVYSIAVGATAASLATADSTTTVAPRYTVLQHHYFSASAAVGDIRTGFEMRFDPPLVVPQGCYFHFVFRPIGTVTSNTLVVTGSLAVNGYFE